jgi:hypothetical protein
MAKRILVALYRAPRRGRRNFDVAGDDDDEEDELDVLGSIDDTKDGSATFSSFRRRRSSS